MNDFTSTVTATLEAAQQQPEASAPVEEAQAAGPETTPKSQGIKGDCQDDFFTDLKRMSFTIGDKELWVETGRVARSTGAAIFLQCDDTFLFTCATATKEPREGIDFFPLLIDVEEKMYSVGRLPGGFLKREGRPSDKSILSARLIDRPIRPLFPDGYRNDVQVVCNPMAVDSKNPPDVLGILAASFALTLAGNIPFLGPVGAVRIGRLDGQFVVNPTYQQLEASDLDLVVAGTESSIMMVEAGADFVSETDLLAALELAHAEIKKQVQAQKDLLPSVVSPLRLTIKPLIAWTV